MASVPRKGTRCTCFVPRTAVLTVEPASACVCLNFESHRLGAEVMARRLTLVWAGWQYSVYGEYGANIDIKFRQVLDKMAETVYMYRRSPAYLHHQHEFVVVFVGGGAAWSPCLCSASRVRVALTEGERLESFDTLSGQDITIVTLCAYDPSVTPLTAWSFATRQRYARRHGYRVRLETQAPNVSQHPAWNKVSSAVLLHQPMAVFSSPCLVFPLWHSCT